LNTKVLISVLLLSLCFNYADAQSYVSRDLIPVNTFKSVDTIFLEKNFKINSSAKAEANPLQIGSTISMVNNFPEKGRWSATEDRCFIWELIVQNDDAQAMNIYLSDLNLKADDLLFVYGTTGKALLIDSKCELNELGTSVFEGGILKIVFKSDEKYLSFKIDEIGIIGSKSNRDFGDAAYCQLPVNCPEGDDYQDIKTGIARILVKQESSLFWCSGSLVNNTSYNRKAYFLTANHCGKNSTEEDYSKWVFDFNFESADCDKPLFEPDKNTIYGSTLLSHAPDEVNAYSDFKLLLLKQNISSVPNAYFIGWDRSNIAPENGVTIHHPQGDIKMISTYNSAVVSTQYYNKNEDPEGKYWKVNWSETQNGHGATEGGSSGSPLLNSDGQIIGTLTGGDASCQFPDDPDWYGKFSYHWESNGNDSTKNLKYWLDPLETNLEALDGKSINTSDVTAAFTCNNPNITIGSGIEFTNLSQGDIIEYNWYFESGDPETSNQREPGTIRYYRPGDFDVKLSVKSATGSDEILFKKYIKVGSQVFPSFTSNYVYVRVGSIPADEIEISVVSSSGNIVQAITNPEILGNNTVKIDLSGNRAGLYVIKVNIAGFIHYSKVILI